MVFLMFQIVKKLGAKSGKQFAAQQAILGQVNGFVEEHIEGQKVVKVFNHEHKVLDEFDRLNTELQEAATNAQFLFKYHVPNSRKHQLRELCNYGSSWWLLSNY